MVVTLFGITVITFAVTRLAPGDPAKRAAMGPGMVGDRDAQQTREIIEMNRRYYGFDKPMLFNLAGADRRSEAEDALHRFLTGSETFSEQAARELLEIDAIALDAIARRLDDAPTSPQVRRLRSLLPLLAERLDRPVPPPDPDAWDQWIRQHRSDASDRELETAADDFARNGDGEAERTLRGAGAYAVAPLISRLDENPERLARVSALLARVTRKPWTVAPNDSAGERAAVLRRWRHWWRYDYVRYSEFGPVRRFVRHFTYTQYGIWLGKVLTLDFDESYTRHQPVLTLIKRRLPISIQLSLISIFLSYIIAIPLGVYSSIRQYSLSDRVITVGLFVLYSLPSFWVGNMLLMYLTGPPYLSWFPSSHLHSPGLEPWTWVWFKDWMWHLVLPIACLTYGSFAFLSRQMRVSMLETVRQDFIRTARAKGLGERTVVFKHALRNSLIPILTLSAALLPELLGGSVIIERIFSIEGMGKLTWEAILERDYPVINGVLFFSALLTLLGILLADLSYAWADPRIKLE